LASVAFGTSEFDDGVVAHDYWWVLGRNQSRIIVLALELTILLVGGVAYQKALIR